MSAKRKQLASANNYHTQSSTFDSRYQASKIRRIHHYSRDPSDQESVIFKMASMKAGGSKHKSCYVLTNIAGS